MSTAGGVRAAPMRPAAGARARRRTTVPDWWPLAALMLLGAALRLSTLDLQSFWYDEAFTPVHVLHPSLWATLRSVAHSENTPPLWYVLAWADARLFGTGEIALRLPSALAGIATVPVAWAIARELADRRAAIACAAFVAVNPLFVWYSQEARAYGLFVLISAVAMMCFLRARREPTARRMAAFALSGVLALLTHYFAVFLLIPMALMVVWEPRTRRAALPAVGVLVLAGLALLALISAQGGHGTQWIGHWPLSERLEAIPQYYLTGYSGAPLGHGVELLVALPILAGLALGLWRARAASPASREGAVIALAIFACGCLIPIALVGFGADYLAPRNLVAAMVPLTALIAVVMTWPLQPPPDAERAPATAPQRPSDASSRRAASLAALLIVASALALLAISIDVNLSPRLERGNWRDVARALRDAPATRAITTVELGSAPLEYYLPSLRGLHEGTSVKLTEIDETGYAPLRTSAGQPPAPGFRLRARLDIDGLVVYRFVSTVPRMVSEATLRDHVITLAPPHVLVPADLRAVVDRGSRGG